MLGLSLGPAAIRRRSVTNRMRNPEMAGALAGTPGTAPTNWNMATSAQSVVRTIIGAGVADGRHYLDVRYAGTPTATSARNIDFEAATYLAATAGQGWTADAFVSLVAGSAAGASVNLAMYEMNSAGVSTGSFSTIPVSVGATPTFAAIYRVFNNAAAAFALGRVSVFYSAGVPIDLTLRIAAPRIHRAT